MSLGRVWRKPCRKNTRTPLFYNIWIGWSVRISKESVVFYGSPGFPQLFFKRNRPFFETSSRPYLLGNTVRLVLPTSHRSTYVLCKQEKVVRYLFRRASLLVPSSHETFDKKKRWMWGGGAIVESLYPYPQIVTRGGRHAGRGVATLSASYARN